MNKTVSLLRARPPIGAAELSEWLAHDCLPKALSDCRAARRCVVYLPQALRPKPGMEMPKTLPYQAIIETWFADAEARGVHAFISDRGFAERVGEMHEYGVEEWVVKDDLDAARRGMSPGIVLWTMLTRVAAQSAADFRRHWAEHAPLAVRVHVGMAAYAQNRVESVLTPDAPLFDGFAALNFRTDEDLRDRLFSSPEEIAEILADSAEFAGTSLSMVCREYVVQSGARS